MMEYSCQLKRVKLCCGKMTIPARTGQAGVFLLENIIDS